MKSALRTACGIVCVLLVPACGGSPAKTAEAPKPAATTPAPTVTAAPLPAHGIRRSIVRRVVAAGFPRFLQTIVLDDQPAMKDGKFQGFRIQELRDERLYGGVDLQPGDVITRVNGMPIEHPEEALEAFKSLEVASELRVDYVRAGVPRDIRFPIVDDEPAAQDKHADASTP